MVDGKRKSGFVETGKTIFWAGLIAILIRTFLFEPFSIPSGSMIPTLLVGDFLFVSKSAYGYSRYSFPFAAAPIEGRLWSTLPERGDVVVFRPPGEPGTDFIKRVIGLPGDRIQVRGGRLVINGEIVPRQAIADYQDPDNPYLGGAPAYIETLPGGRQHLIIESEGDRGPLDDTPTYVIPAGHYFMMGDNRDRSNDSRVLRFDVMADPAAEISDPAAMGKVGFVPFANLIGPAKILFWSYDSNFTWTNPLTWATALRGNRLGSFVE